MKGVINVFINLLTIFNNLTTPRFKLEMFNIHYFVHLLLCALVVVIFYLILKRVSDKNKERILFGVLLAAFVIHFLKMFIWPYTTIDFPDRFRKVSFENISATHTLIFPWLFLSKNKTAKDYLVMAGITTGLLPILLPLDAIRPFFDGNPSFGYKPAYSIEVFRFYFAHLVFFMVPFLMMVFGLHKIEAKRFYRIPMMFFLVLTLLFVNEYVLVKTGLVPEYYNNLKWTHIDSRNPSFIFGVSSDVSKYAGFVMIFVPKFMRGTDNFWPVIWLVGPLIVYGNLFALFYAYIFDKEGTKALFHKKDPNIKKVEEK